MFLILCWILWFYDCVDFYFFFLKWQSVLFPTKALNSYFYSGILGGFPIMPFSMCNYIFQWIASLLVSEEKSFTFTNSLIFFCSSSCALHCSFKALDFKFSPSWESQQIWVKKAAGFLLSYYKAWGLWKWNLQSVFDILLIRRGAVRNSLNFNCFSMILISLICMCL